MPPLNGSAPSLTDSSWLLAKKAFLSYTSGPPHEFPTLNVEERSCLFQANYYHSLMHIYSGFLEVAL